MKYLFLPLVLLFMTGCGNSDVAPEMAQEPATPAPDFELATMDGDTFRLADRHGDVVVVNFWATWCAPCRAEIPDFVELQHDLGDRGLVFVGVSLDEEGFDIVRPFAEEFEINYPIVVDHDGEVSRLFGGIHALPTTIIIDRQGRIRHRVASMLTHDVLLPALEALLQES